jgi:hypothetical protein
MFEKTEFPMKDKGVSTAGVTIHLNQEDKAEPFDITLYIKKPRDGEKIDPDDENSFTTTGKLTFRFGRKGSVELLAENTMRVNETLPGQEEGV